MTIARQYTNYYSVVYYKDSEVCSPKVISIKYGNITAIMHVKVWLFSGKIHTINWIFKTVTNITMHVHNIHFSGFSSNYVAFTSGLLEYFEEMFLAICNN